MVRPNDEWVARVSHLRPGFSGRRNERAFGLYPRTNRTGAPCSHQRCPDFLLRRTSHDLVCGFLLKKAA
jgi:hypothetical protein